MAQSEHIDTSGLPVVKATRRAIMPRIQSVMIPILRDWPDLQGVHIGSWGNDIDYREFPFINLRRIEGGRDPVYYNKFDLAIIEMTAYSDEGIIECEHLYNIALEALYDAVRFQKQTDAGYLHSLRENMGMTQFSSKFMDSWRVQGLLKMGLRPKSVLH
jgi:hypothetical protein